MTLLESKHKLERAIEEQGLKDLLPIANNLHEIWVEETENAEFVEQKEETPKKSKKKVKKMFPCHLCDRKFKGEGWLKNHLQFDHGVPKKQRERALKYSKKEHEKMMLSEAPA